MKNLSASFVFLQSTTEIQMKRFDKSRTWNVFNFFFYPFITWTLESSFAFKNPSFALMIVLTQVLTLFLEKCHKMWVLCHLNKLIVTFPCVTCIMHLKKMILILKMHWSLDCSMNYNLQLRSRSDFVPRSHHPPWAFAVPTHLHPDTVLCAEPRFPMELHYLTTVVNLL